MQGCLAKVLLFKQLDPSMQRKVVSETYERTVQAGEILITEGDTGLAASELYIVKSGEFEVLLGPHCLQKQWSSIWMAQQALPQLWQWYAS